jgi:hypothetical protein
MSELLKIKEEIKLPSIGYYGKPFFRDPENAEVGILFNFSNNFMEVSSLIIREKKNKKFHSS